MRNQPVAERRITSVLFGDLVGFTTASESRDQEESRELLSRFFDGCRQVVGRYGGTIEKFIGDAVMAVWGVPTAHEDDAERAVRAGLELVRMVTELGIDVGSDSLAMRVGIVTGEVAVTIGAEQQGMVAGDPVNTASRVQSIAAPGAVWVDETTRLLTAAAISYSDVGSHALKGKADPVALWSANAVVGAIRGSSRADGLEAPFVGRDRELRLVRELFHGTSENGRAALLVVDGEPGLGKTRLGWEFFKYIDGLAQETYWHQGRCLAYGEGIAYWAITEAVRLRLSRLAGREDDETDGLVEEGLAAVVPDLEERAWLTPRLAALFAGGSVGTFAREELFTAWVTFFERVSGGEEVVLLIDDAQYADDGVLAFVEHLLETSSFPCLVVLLTRPGLIERRPALATNRRATLLHLADLDQRDMTALMNGLVAGLPEDVCAALVERAEGVPLYAVETVRSLIDRDLVVPRGGHYVLVDPDLDIATMGAPASLQALVTARLDALQGDERRVVNQGSILGTSFTLDGLRALCPGVDVETVVEELIRLQILTRDTNRLSTDYRQLRFVQSVVRQVAYGTLSKHDRRAGHLAVARYLQDVELATEIDAVLAQHYLDAAEALPHAPDVPELEAQAIALLQRAAERAAALGVPDDAAGHLATALAHSHDPWQRAELLRLSAWAMIDAARLEEAVAAASEATAAFDALGDDVAAGRATAAWARALAMVGDHAASMELSRPRFDALRDREDAARATLELSLALSGSESALGMDPHDTLDVRMRLADRLGEPGALADGLRVLSTHYFVTGAPGVGRILLEAAANLAREHQLAGALGGAVTNLGSSEMAADLEASAAYSREAITVLTRAGLKSQVAIAQANLATVLMAAGRWDELDAHLGSADGLLLSVMNPTAVITGTLAALDRGLPVPDVAPASGVWTSPPDLALFQLAEAVHALAAGDLAAACASATESTRTVYEYGGTSDDFIWSFSVATDLARALDQREAMAELLALVERPEEEPPGLRGYFLRARGWLEDSEGDLRESVAAFEAWRSPLWRTRTQEDLGLLLAGQGRSEEAGALLDTVRASYTSMGAHGLLARLEQQLEHAPSS